MQQRALAARGVHPSLEVGAPDDAFEREADAVADRVMRMPEPTVQRAPVSPSQTTEKKKPEDAPVRREADNKKKPEDVPVRRQADNTKQPEGAPVRRQAHDTKKREDTPVRREADNKKKLEDTSVRRQADTKKRPEETPLRRAVADNEVEKKEPDETTLRRATADSEVEKKEPDETPLRRQAEKKKPDDTVRRVVGDELQPSKDIEALRADRDGGPPSVSPAMESSLRAGRGGGQPLSPDSRSFFEPRMGADLSAVRLHTDAGAAAAARDINARAFTYGNDIYFASGRYQPHTDSGRHLLAHELAHTQQQGASVPSGASSAQVHKLNEPTGPAGAAPATGATTEIDPATIPLEHGRPDLTANTLTFDRLEIPGFKLQEHRGTLYNTRKPLKQRRAYERGNPAQRDRWREALEPGIEPARARIQEKINQAHANEPPAAGATHVLSAPSRFGRNPPRYFIGTPDVIAREMVLPTWSNEGVAQAYDVDHIVELQLADWNSVTWPNDVGNMELLDSVTNQESGRVILDAIRRKVQHFIDYTHGQYGTNVGVVKDRFQVVFNDVGAGEAGVAAAPSRHFWRKEQIDQGLHINDCVRVEPLSVLGGQDRVLVFPGAAGGVPKGFAWPNTAITSEERNWLKPYTVTAKQFDVSEASATSETLGTLSFNIAPDDPVWAQFEGGDASITVRRVPGARFAGTIDKNRVRDSLRSLRHKHLSPIEIDSFDLMPDRGVVLEGRIISDLPLLRGASLNFELANGDLRLYKEFNIGDFTLPRPFIVNDCSLTLSVGTRSGLSMEGRLGFGIERVGEGDIVGSIGTGGGLAVEGRFNFDTSLFDPAQIRLAYREGQLSGEGTLGIPNGKVRGIRSATINIAYANEALTATGTAQLSIPGVQQADVRVEYSEAEGLLIGGTVQLANDIPGIRSGSLEATVRKPPDSDDYIFSARGTAVPAIPGVDATLAVAYDNGALTIEGTAAYSRGMLSGSVQLGATNKPLDAQGNPLPDAEPGTELRAYGGGQVTIRIAPWLQGTVGVRLLPNGEIEVSGEIGLPAALDVFPEKRLDKNIFSIGLDIPIVGVAIAGQRIGVFATIRGGLDASAGIGPGQLRDLRLGITYNPAHEDQTHVTGDASLVVPAQAGLRLFVRGGLGVGIPIVSATAALEVGGTLGLVGEARADVHMDWMPSTGLSIDALGSITVQPKFTFDVTGMVLVEADLLITTVELYSKRWQLASFEYGSDMRFGIHFPIHYQEGQPFDIALSDVEFEVPQIEPSSLLAGLIERIA